MKQGNSNSNEALTESKPTENRRERKERRECDARRDAVTIEQPTPEVENVVSVVSEHKGVWGAKEPAWASEIND